MKIKSLIFLVCLIHTFLVVSCQETQDIKQKDVKYLQEPDFLSPKGKLVTTHLLSDELFDSLIYAHRPACDIWPVSAKRKLSSIEINKMVKILSDDRIIGNGIYYESGYCMTFGLYPNYYT
jgi:hypothetical protein